jgi:DNA-binding NtrC family response regulator
MERKQVFYINKIRFVCDTVENICENSHIECYTLEESNDFSFLINDLKPQLVIIDVKTLIDNDTDFWSEIDKSDIKPKIMLSGIGSSDFAKESSHEFDFIYDQMIDIITFGQTLKSHLE